MKTIVFKTEVADAVRGLEGPFTFADVASRMGADYAPGGEGERRLRRALDALKKKGLIQAAGRGLMIKAEGRETASMALLADIYTFLRANGGLMRIDQFVKWHDLDEVGYRTTHRLLEAGRDAGRFDWLVFMDDGKIWWGLPEAERLKLPLPGWRITADLCLDSVRHGGWCRQGLKQMRDRREAIGLSLQDARDALELDLDDVLALVGDVFVADLLKGRATVLTQPTMTLGEYWTTEIEKEGQEAVRRAWLELEMEPGFGAPWPGTALSAATWVRFGEAFGVDPAATSRGYPRWKPDPTWRNQ